MRKICFFGAVLAVLHLFTPAIYAAPDVSASSAILMEAESGTVLVNLDAHRQMRMASTTKIMTALVALTHSDVADKVVVSEKAVGIEGSSVYLKAGETLTMEELLYALLLESANDAAAAIAIAVAGDIPSFADLMNETALEIGLTESHFTNPHGLDDEGHYTTAYDLALLTRYALSNPDFARIVSTYKTTIPLNGAEGTRVLVNHNKMLKSYDGAIGVKTGYTRKSGRCLVSAAERDGVTMIAVTLSAPDDWRDHTALLDYGFSLYTSVQLADIGEYRCTLPCLGADVSEITASNHAEVSSVLPKNHGAITVRFLANRPIAAPILLGDEVGEIVFICDGKEIARVPLCADVEASRVSPPLSLWDRVRGTLHLSSLNKTES